MPTQLKEKIKNKKAIVGIIGLGYTGLPLALTLADAGFLVYGIDIDQNRVDLLKKGKSYIDDVPDGNLRSLINKKQFMPAVNYDIFKNLDIVCICLPTPLDKHKQPDMSYIQAALDEIKKRLRRGQLIILESTTYPGTTEELFLPQLATSGLKVGQDFFLAFAPERIDPGNKQYSLRKTPQVVGGITKTCGQLTQLFYQQIIDQVILVSSPRVAEMTKLLENIFRVVNISLINELALLCGKMKIDIWEVIEAAKTKPYGFMPFYPGPGVGGHCIPVDPFYLSWRAKEYNFFTRFIDLAGEINELMPHYVITQIIWALNQQQKPIKNSKILVLGVAYKKDIGDTRESPALKIIEDLLKKKARISYHDPFVPVLEIANQKLKSIKLSLRTLKDADCLLILTDHSNYDYEDLARQSQLVVDTRNAVKNKSIKHVFCL
ncbi:MAG: UDP-N-acetyl-D-glucosamine dehydrogenase [Candidatus Portnoybacteria bacterium CG10_big_fil_rev_8_21_14_0_10_40_22]|uniref:UDP-N-acetyl-D-glucosamine dehydrogenase n=1 Tax=Candidatus Portnoybacteria bacterium CG10_big_fil_rev_8_21_14_0_10_40_22 TaxID=1974814 RepID=A0A2M8KFR7_9BACT|nr:MAG: UDP-N-acetyl-D-glucosamine dehydrogenase [Candidatus Portnoybacteria bacterium CG10_big_fil_rev_8_21_14_0_10_40_22]